MYEATQTNLTSQFIRIPADASWIDSLPQQADPSRQISGSHQRAFGEDPANQKTPPWIIGISSHPAVSPIASPPGVFVVINLSDYAALYSLDTFLTRSLSIHHRLRYSLHRQGHLENCEKQQSLAPIQKILIFFQVQSSIHRTGCDSVRMKLLCLSEQVQSH